MPSPVNVPPIVAILRGVQPDEVVQVAEVLVASGIRGLEVPLNSPDPLLSIRRLSAAYGATCLCGAGTVLTESQVDEVAAAGGLLIVTPNTDSAVIRRSVELGLTVMPGFATATEAFTALHSGATALKLFPAATYGPKHLKALRAVLPPIAVFAVGGVGVPTIPEWVAAGVEGIAVGSEVYAPGRSLEDIRARAESIVAAFETARRQRA